MDQNRTPLLDAIVEYTEKRPAYFKIPGHRYERGISPRWTKWTGEGIFRFDLTEAEGLDDLHCPEGVIREAQELAAEVFCAKKTYFLVNGTTCGNEAMVMSCVGDGEEIMVPRNAHKSVLMGLILCGAKPVYLMPQIDEKTGLCGCITPQEVERGFKEHPGCKGVFLVNPTYYGVCSDIESISRVCHEHGALLLVDEAHGGHLYFNREKKGTGELPRGAILQGADMCAQSMHKVTGSLTQSSLLHVGSEQVDTGRLESNLHLVQSTSPSYLLMTSLDAARYELALHGDDMLAHTLELSQNARERINQIPGIKCYGREIIGQAVFDLDTTRLVISADSLGISGFDLADRLYEEFGVGLELSDEKHVVAIVTYANTMEDVDRLVTALEGISSDLNGRKREGNAQFSKPVLWDFSLPEYVLSPRTAYFSKKKKIKWEDAEGKIAGEALIPYPPGIPLINPGERINRQVWSYMERYRKMGLHFHGPEDKLLETIHIIEE
ncbi:MAG: aminotransferase class V-fold PLP-dependent enzyme [Clostridia bacterium]|nr:aminotransferase class V-fold PLP-dependent enzyme [Clostridia bacterium]NCC43913.1 aminotransferase class V-fold PLP-dependent enzyme [Clostridia bacterium]